MTGLFFALAIVIMVATLVILSRISLVIRILDEHAKVMASNEQRLSRLEKRDNQS